MNTTSPQKQQLSQSKLNVGNTQEQNIDYNAINNVLKQPFEERTDRQINEIYSSIRQLPYFERYHNLGYTRLIKKTLRHFQLIDYKQLWTIFEANSTGNYFYILLRGKVGVFFPRTKEEQDQLKKQTKGYPSNLNTLEKQIQYDKLINSFEIQKYQLEKTFNYYQEQKNIFIQLQNSNIRLKISKTNLVVTTPSKLIHNIQDQSPNKKKQPVNNNKPPKKLLNPLNLQNQTNPDATPKGYKPAKSPFSKDFVEGFTDKIQELDLNEESDIVQDVYITEQDKKALEKMFVIDHSYTTNEHPDHPELNPPSTFRSIEELLIRHKQVAYLQEGSAFGEIALLFDKNRAAAIVALEDCQVLCMEKKDFQLILKQKEMEKQYEKMSFIFNHPLFCDFDRIACCMIYLNCQEMQVNKKQVIFCERDEADAVYLIKNGEFQIEKSFIEDINGFQNKKSERQKKKYKKKNIQRGKQYKVCILGEGHLVGEESFMENEEYRAYSLICESQTGCVIRISYDEFVNRIISNKQSSQYIRTQSNMKLQLLKKHFSRIRQQIKERYQQNNSENDEDQEDTYDHQVIKNFVQNRSVLYKIKNQRKGRIIQESLKQEKQAQESNQKELQQLHEEFMKQSPLDIFDPKKLKAMQDRQLKIDKLKKQIPSKCIAQKKIEKQNDNELTVIKQNPDKFEQEEKIDESQLVKRKFVITKDNYQQLIDQDVFYMQKFQKDSEKIQRRMKAFYLSTADGEQEEKERISQNIYSRTQKQNKQQQKQQTNRDNQQPHSKDDSLEIMQHKIKMDKYKMMKDLKEEKTKQKLQRQYTTALERVNSQNNILFQEQENQNTLTSQKQIDVDMTIHESKEIIQNFEKKNLLPKQSQYQIQSSDKLANVLYKSLHQDHDSTQLINQSIIRQKKEAKTRQNSIEKSSSLNLPPFVRKAFKSQTTQPQNSTPYLLENQYQKNNQNGNISFQFPQIPNTAKSLIGSYQDLNQSGYGTFQHKAYSMPKRIKTQEQLPFSNMYSIENLNNPSKNIFSTNNPSTFHSISNLQSQSYLDQINTNLNNNKNQKFPSKHFKNKNKLNNIKSMDNISASMSFENSMAIVNDNSQLKKQIQSGKIHKLNTLPQQYIQNQQQYQQNYTQQNNKNVNQIQNISINNNKNLQNNINSIQLNILNLNNQILSQKNINQQAYIQIEENFQNQQQNIENPLINLNESDTSPIKPPKNHIRNYSNNKFLSDNSIDNYNTLLEQKSENQDSQNNLNLIQSQGQQTNQHNNQNQPHHNQDQEEQLQTKETLTNEKTTQIENLSPILSPTIKEKQIKKNNNTNTKRFQTEQ